jgi:tetratricopeptide (TPR) repeat protein
VFDYGTFLAAPGQIAAAAIAVVAIGAASFIAIRKYRPLVFALVLAAGVLAPSSSIIPVTTQTVAEHRMYLPLAVVILLTVAAVYMATHRLKRRFPGRVVVPAIRTVVFAAAAAALSSAALNRNNDYKSEFAIWNDTFEKRPLNARAAVYLGTTLINQNNGNPPEASISLALSKFSRAIEIDSAFGLAFANRGLAYYRMKRPDDALRDYNRAIDLQTIQQGNRAELFNNRGILLGETGRTTEAVADFNAAIRLNPDFVSAHSNLGSAYANLGHARAVQGDSAGAVEKYKRSIAHYTSAIRLDPKSAAAYRGRASIYGKLGRFAEAGEDCSAIMSIDPADAAAVADRAICNYQTGRFRESWQDVQLCRKLGGIPNTDLILLLAKELELSK